MAGRTAKALLLGDEERAELEALTRATSVSAGVAQRARIVLLAADATPNHKIAELVGVSRPTVNKWRDRFGEQRLAGLVDVARLGPERRIDPRRIVAKTLTPPPKRLAVTHWSSRLLAAELGVSHVTIAQAWKDYGVKPWKADTFKLIRNAPNHR